MKKVLLVLLFGGMVAFSACNSEPANEADDVEYTEDNSVMGAEPTMDENPAMENAMTEDTSMMNDAIGMDSADMEMMDKK